MIISRTYYTHLDAYKICLSSNNNLYENKSKSKKPHQQLFIKHLNQKHILQRQKYQNCYHKHIIYVIQNV